MTIGQVSIQGQNLLVLGGEHTTINEEVAKVARDQFTQNYNQNCLYSKYYSLAGVSSFIGFGLVSVLKWFAFPIPAVIGLAGISFIIGRLWINNRDQEGYALQKACGTADDQEDEIIQKLSLGANIYYDVRPSAKGPSMPVMQAFAMRGCTKVVAYLASLEPDLEKRAEMVTDALPFAKNKETAQLLIDLGAKINLERGSHWRVNFLMYRCCLGCCSGKDFELLRFFVDAGAKLDAGITDYKKWQSDLDKRQKQFKNSGDDEKVSSNIDSGFYTPLETFLESVSSKLGFVEVFEAMKVGSDVYQNKNSAEDLYHALNEAGVRIRLQKAKVLFEQLQRSSTI